MRQPELVFAAMYFSRIFAGYLCVAIKALKRAMSTDLTYRRMIMGAEHRVLSAGY